MADFYTSMKIMALLFAPLTITILNSIKISAAF